MNEAALKTLYLPEMEEQCQQRLMRLMQRTGLEHPLIVDVGANTGQSIEHFKSIWPASVIHAFEPNPSTFQQLSESYGNRPDVFLNATALADRNGPSAFYATRVSEVASLLPPTEKLRGLSAEKKYEYEKIEVVCDTLDQYCQRQHLTQVDLLKIDVQGAELAVLQGAKHLLSQHAISFIYIETTFAESYENQTHFSSVINFLHGSGQGYELWDISPFLYTSRDQLWATNSIFIAQPLANQIK